MLITSYSTQKNTDKSSEQHFTEAVHQLQLQAVTSTSEGLLFEMAQAHFQGKGKNLRPRILHGMAQVLGLSDQRVTPWAACCEMLHNATLVHDDLQDGDEVRRNRPTVWKLYGKNQAINLGDYLLSLAPSFVFSSSAFSDREKVLLGQAYCQMSTQIVGGQCRDIHLFEHFFAKNLFSLYLRCTQ